MYRFVPVDSDFYRQLKTCLAVIPFITVQNEQRQLLVWPSIFSRFVLCACACFVIDERLLIGGLPEGMIGMWLQLPLQCYQTTCVDKCAESWKMIEEGVRGSGSSDVDKLELAPNRRALA